MNTFYEKNFGLENKRAVVTGAGRGIGRAIAEAFAAVGAEVLVHYHTSKDAAMQVVDAIQSNGGKAWAEGADLTNSAETNIFFDKVGKKWGSLDILVNNAGDLVKRSTIENFSDELLETVLKVNIHSAVYSCRDAIPLLKRGGAPSIINIGSIAAHNGGLNGAAMYAAAKGAIHTLTRGLAKELAPDIRVNAIAPGIILTDFHLRHSTEANLNAVAANTPLKRSGKPEEIAAAAVFLSGQGASYITGEIIEINGGLWLA